MKGPESCDGMIEMSARVSRKHETRSQSVAGNGNRVGGDLTRQFQSVTGKLEDYSPRNMILCLKFIVTLSRHTKRQGDGSVLNIISYSWRNVVLWLEGRVQFPGTLTRQSQGVSRDWTSIGRDNYSPSNERLMSELDGRIKTLRWESMVHFPGNMTRQSQNITKEWNSIGVNNLNNNFWFDNWRSVAIPWKCDKTAPGRLNKPWRRTIQSQCQRNYFRFSNTFL